MKMVIRDKSLENEINKELEAQIALGPDEMHVPVCACDREWLEELQSSVLGDEF